MPALRALLAMCAVLVTVLASGRASAWAPPVQAPASLSTMTLTSTWTPPSKEKTRVWDFSENPLNSITPLGAELRPGARKKLFGEGERVRGTLFNYAHQNPVNGTDPTGHRAEFTEDYDKPSAQSDPTHSSGTTSFPNPDGSTDTHSWYMDTYPDGRRTGAETWTYTSPWGEGGQRTFKDGPYFFDVPAAAAEKDEARTASAKEAAPVYSAGDWNGHLWDNEEIPSQGFITVEYDNAMVQTARAEQRDARRAPSEVRGIFGLPALPRDYGPHHGKLVIDLDNEPAPTLAGAYFPQQYPAGTVFTSSDRFGAGLFAYDFRTALGVYQGNLTGYKHHPESNPACGRPGGCWTQTGADEAFSDVLGAGAMLAADLAMLVAPELYAIRVEGMLLRGAQAEVRAVSAARGLDAMEAGRLGGALFPESRLPYLERLLGRHGIGLRVGDEFLPRFAAGGFDAERGLLLLKNNPTRYEVQHELSHFLQCRRLGRARYSAQSRLQKEQFVFDMLENNPRRWTGLTTAQREHASWYIVEQLGGVR